MSNIVVSGTGSASLSALIQQYYMPVLYDNIFKKSHPLLAILKAKAKTFNGREIVVPIEHADAGVSVFGDRHGLANADSPATGYTPIKAEIAKTASYNPTMLTGHFLVTKEETLLMNSPQAIKNIVGAKVKNLQKGLEKKVAENLFATSLATDAFNPLGVLLDDSATAGGLAPGSNSWWKTPVLDVTAFSDASGEHTTQSPQVAEYITEANMVDASKNTYILRILAKGVANARAQTGENPDLIVVPQYLYDLIESEIDPRKTGSKMSEKMGSMGFTGLNFRGIDIIADQDMVTAQQQVVSPAVASTNFDGRIYFINTEYLHMFFNSGAKFTASDMIEDTQSNTFVQKVHTYGNMVVTNRKAHCVVQDLYSPLDYA